MMGMEDDVGHIADAEPWNEGGNWEIVEAPELEQGVENLESSNGKDATSKRETSPKDNFKSRKRAS
jgi:hypothetical protein